MRQITEKRDTLMRTKTCWADEKIRRIQTQFGHEDLKKGHRHKDSWITGLTDTQISSPANGYCKQANETRLKADTTTGSPLNLPSVNYRQTSTRCQGERKTEPFSNVETSLAFEFVCLVKLQG